MHEPTPVPASPLKPFEEHIAEAGLDPFMAAAMKAYLNLPQGREMTREAFDKALGELQSAPIHAR